MIQQARIVSVVSLFPMPQYVVVLEDIEKTRLVPIWIGVNEGNAIAMEMQGEKFPRPLTHDLIVNLLQTLEARIEKIVINDLRDNSYFALIHLVSGARRFEIDARPSDSLALAVRIGCPIYIDETVLRKCPKIEKPITKEEIDKFKAELKTMSPEEFFKGLEETPVSVEEPQIHSPEPGDESAPTEEDGEEGEEDDPDSPESDPPGGRPGPF